MDNDTPLTPTYNVTYEDYIKLRETNARVIKANLDLIRKNEYLLEQLKTSTAQNQRAEKEVILNVVAEALDNYYNLP